MSQTKLPLSFRIFKGGQLIDVKQFPGPQVTIGQEGQIDLVISDSEISPIHAMVEERESGRFYLCDLGGPAGTLVNGQKIVDVELSSGDEFQIGGHVLEFHIGVPKPKKAAPPPEPMASTPFVSNRVEPLVNKPVGKKPVLPKTLPKKPDAVPQARSKESFGTQSMMIATSSGMPTSSLRAGKGTYAPQSSAELEKVVKPGAGPVVQIILSWQGRVLNTFHYDNTRIINIGSAPTNDIILPIFGSIRITHPILKIEGGLSTVFLTPDMTGELVRENTITPFQELKRQNRLLTAGAGDAYIIQPNELVRVNLGEGVQLTISYVNTPPPSKFLPFLDLTANQITTLVVGFLAATLFFLYTFVYTPPELEKPEDELETKKVAKFIYKRRVEEIKPDAVEKGSAPQNIKDKEVAQARGEEGASNDAPPTESKSEKKIPTAAKPGTGKGIQKASTQVKKAAAAPKVEKRKDVNTTGLLGVFGKGGVQDELNKAYEGAGNVAGLSGEATGSGAEALGSGTTPGTGLREVGKGGKGTATVGISGIKTAGRGGGVSGYGTGSLGAKQFASIVAGDNEATFTGTIDKEAIRRVVQKNLREIKACYEKGLNRDPSIYGKIVIQWSIGSGGRVLEAGIKRSTMNSSVVEQCAVARLRTWKFPEPPVNEVAVVSYPFVFQAQE